MSYLAFRVGNAAEREDLAQKAYLRTMRLDQVQGKPP